MREGNYKPMKNYQDFQLLAMLKLSDLNIHYGKITKWTTSNNSVHRWGQARKLMNGTYEIDINECLLRDDSSDDGLLNTIIHELLHTVDGCMKHTGKWKLLADKVNQAYGYDIKRCSTADEKGISTEWTNTVAKATHKYMCKCSKCGKEVWRQKISDFIRYPEIYQCCNCGGIGTFKRMV